MKTMKITLKCELHSSLPYSVLNNGIVKIVQENYGYIRELDKSINLGKKVLAVMTVDDYQARIKERQNIWKEVSLDWEGKE